MDIAKYLSSLITSQDQVTIPGLGKLYKKRVNGYYHKESNSYFPPNTEIYFTTDYAHDDKLVQYISSNSEHSLSKSYAILDEFVKKIRNSLKTEPVKLEGIGTLQQKEHQIYLLPDKHPQFNKAYFGLSEINIADLSSLDDDDTNHNLANQAIQSSTFDDSEDRKSSFVKIVLISVFSLMVAALTALYFINPGFYEQLLNHKSEVNTKPIEQKIEPKPVPLTIPDSNSIEKEKDSLINQTDTVETINSVPPEKSTIIGDTRYEIVIATFEKTKEEEARKHVEYMNKRGYPVHIVEDAQGSSFKISGAIAYNQEDADKELRRLKKLNPNAWPLRIKIRK